MPFDDGDYGMEQHSSDKPWHDAPQMAVVRCEIDRERLKFALKNTLQSRADWRTACFIMTAFASTLLVIVVLDQLQLNLAH
jgi:hypothetical protein